MSRLEKMYKEWKDRVAFHVVYIREAHPSDGWQVRQNERDGVEYKEPKSYEERCKVASQCIKDLKLSMPALVDDMKDTAEKAYSGWPDRLYVVGKDGKLIYCGERGPRGFKPDEVEEVLEGLKAEDLKQENKEEDGE